MRESAGSGRIRLEVDMSEIPVIGFAAYSGTGKTTLIEKIVLRLTAMGIRTAVIKHGCQGNCANECPAKDVRTALKRECHGFEIDKEGKDSYRYTKAGSVVTVLNSPKKTAFIEQRALSLEDILKRIHDVDVIFVEGYKHSGIRQIGLARKAAGKVLPDRPERYMAIVTDEEIPCAVPQFSFEDIEGITGFILSFIRDFVNG